MWQEVKVKVAANEGAIRRHCLDFSQMGIKSYWLILWKFSSTSLLYYHDDCSSWGLTGSHRLPTASTLIPSSYRYQGIFSEIQFWLRTSLLWWLPHASREEFKFPSQLCKAVHNLASVSFIASSPTTLLHSLCLYCALCLKHPFSACPPI